MKRSGCAVLLLLCALMGTLAGCGLRESPEPVGEGTESPMEATKAPVEERVDGLTVPISALGSEPQFIDWTQDGVAMQIIALKDGDGQPQLAYNTCQVCAGSPYAYFVYEDGALVCMNCGNRFALSSVGKTSGGCNPKPVTDYQVETDSLVIPEAVLAQAAASFQNWKVFQ